MNCDRIFVILGHFLAFYPLTTQKIKIFKKKKKILHKCTKTHDHMLYCSWDMVHDRCNLHFSFWTIFCPEKPKLKKKKMKKKTYWRYYHFTRVPKDMTKNYDHTMNDY